MVYTTNRYGYPVIKYAKFDADFKSVEKTTNELNVNVRFVFLLNILCLHTTN
jgi:hypothetical protein